VDATHTHLAALLRAALAAIESVQRPAPTRRHESGAEWEVIESLPRPSVWRVRAHNGERGLISWQLPECERISAAILPGDWSCLAVPDARRLAVALLAAADHAEESGSGQTRITLA